MHYHRVIVGAVLLTASTGGHGAVWSPALGNGPGSSQYDELWPLTVSGTFSMEVIPGVADFASLAFEFTFGSSFRLTRPDGNVLEQDVSWSGSTTLPFDGTGWGVTTNFTSQFLPEQQPAPVPLPAAGVLFPAGLGMIAVLRRRRRRSAA